MFIDIWYGHGYFPHYFSVLAFWNATGGIVVWYQRSGKSGQLYRKFPFKLTTSNIKPYLFNVFSIDPLIEIKRVAIKVSAQMDSLCEWGRSWNEGVVWDYQIISYQPSEWGGASRSAASCCAEAEHNECGGREPQQSRGRGCLGTRGPWPTAKHTHTQILLHTCGFLRKQFS